MACSTQASLSSTISLSLLKLMSIDSVMPSNHFILCRPLLLLPSIFPSIKVFSNELAFLIRWPKYWSFRSVLPMNIQDWSPLGLTSLISLQSKGLLSRVFSSTTVQKHQFFDAQPSFRQHWTKMATLITTLCLHFPHWIDATNCTYPYKFGACNRSPSLNGKYRGGKHKLWQALFSWAPNHCGQRLQPWN